jgi:hypothetical protein
LNDSGEEDEDEEALKQQDKLLAEQEDLKKPFPQYDNLDGGSSDEEEIEAAGGDEDIPVYTQVLHPEGIDNLGEDHSMDYDFVFGRPPGYNPHQKYITCSAVVLHKCCFETCA